MPFLPVLLYAVAKYAAYAGWCALLPREGNAGWWRRPAGLGLLRLLVGIAVGGLVALAGAHLSFASRNPLPFLALLLPIRWLEWNLVATFASGLPLLPQFVLAGPSGRARLWSLGGILVSFGTDVLAVLALGTMRALVC